MAFVVWPSVFFRITKIAFQICYVTQHRDHLVVNFLQHLTAQIIAI